MTPRSQLYGRTFIGSGRKERTLALTFDDGPNDPYTFQLLETLSRHQVKATFFCMGKYAAQRPDIVRNIVAEGHTVANHTYTHPNLIFRSSSCLRDEITRCEQALDDAVGEKHAHLFRPPWGARTPWVLRTVRQLGFEPVLWSVTGYDWSARSAAEIVRKCSRQIRGGDVILLHDGGHQSFGTDRLFTVRATDELLKRYIGEGYAFRTVPEMMAGPAFDSEAAV